MNIYKKYFITFLLLVLSLAFYYKAIKNMRNAVRIKKNFNAFLIDLANRGYFVNRDKFILQEKELIDYLKKCSLSESEIKIEKDSNFLKLNIGKCSFPDFYKVYKCLVKISNLEILSFYYSADNVVFNIRIRT